MYSVLLPEVARRDACQNSRACLQSFLDCLGQDGLDAAGPNFHARPTGCVVWELCGVDRKTGDLQTDRVPSRVLYVRARRPPFPQALTNRV